MPARTLFESSRQRRLTNFQYKDTKKGVKRQVHCYKKIKTEDRKISPVAPHKSVTWLSKVHLLSIRE